MKSEIYREKIIEHYRHPRNYGKLKRPDLRAKDSNPLCGDEIEIQIELGKDNTVKDVRFNGKSCAITTASASMFTESIKGKQIGKVIKIDNSTILHLLGLEELQLNSARLQCAVLPLKALKKGIRNYLDESNKK